MVSVALIALLLFALVVLQIAPAGVLQPKDLTVAAAAAVCW
jgi:hypothetical protein